MVLSFLIAGIRTRGVRGMPVLAVAASAAVAFIVVGVTAPASRMVRGVDGVSTVQFVQDEHTLIGEYLREKAQADRAADAAADRAWVRERSLAKAEAGHRVAVLKSALARPAVTKSAQMARMVEPAPQGNAVGEPLPLQAALAPSMSRRRPVMERVKSAIASVERFPHWMTAGVEQAAEWVTDLPVGAIVRLPEPRFL